MFVSKEVIELLEKMKRLNISDMEYVIMGLLKSKKIDYVEFSNMYNAYLKNEIAKKNDNIHGMAIPLVQYFQSDKIKPEKQRTFIRCKTAYHLLKSGVYKTAGIEKELQELVDKHGYSEDEHQIPSIIGN